jgi:uncharacterized coiled-coil protein SlyX
MSEDETRGLMNKETWYRAFEAKDRATLINKKIVDGVFSSGKTIDKSKLRVKNAGSLAALYNSIYNEKNMSKLNTLLKLSNSADESEQEAAIVALNKSVTDKEAELADLRNQLKLIQDKVAAEEVKAKEALKTKATELVNKLEKDGKISKEDMPSVLEVACESESKYAFVQNTYSKLSSSKESKKPFDFTKVKNSTGEEDRSTWSYSDWEKKDAAGLTNMFKNDNDAYQELFNKQYSK